MSEVTMAAKFNISDSESEPSEEVEEGESRQPSTGEEQAFQRHSLTLPELRLTGSGRIRLNSESHAATVSRDQELQARGEEEAGTPTEGAPFRVRSLSAPPALWAAKKYGRQLRRMSDEFDNLLDKGEMRRVRSAGSAGRQMHHSRSWWSYLFSHQETEGENNHHDNHTQRNE